MKRNKNLQSLSRDHHHGLLLGWKIRQGLKFLASPEEIVEYISYFSIAALYPHFEEEENLILTYLADGDSLKQRTLQEHKMIKDLINTLVSDHVTEPASLLKVAQLLDDHIRFEERELFPYLEKILSAEQLEEMGLAIDSNHKPFIEVFANEFWSKHAN